MYLVQAVNGVKRAVLTEFSLDVYSVMRTRRPECFDTYCAIFLGRGLLLVGRARNAFNGKKIARKKFAYCCRKPNGWLAYEPRRFVENQNATVNIDDRSGHHVPRVRVCSVQHSLQIT